MRIAITTLGCKINQYDSAVIQDRLGEKHSFVSFDQPADFYIINSCTVTDRADWEARQLVRRAKRLRPQAKVLVTGCYAQTNPQDVAGVPGVDYVIGLNRLNDLIRFVEFPGHCEPNVLVNNVKRERTISVLGTQVLPGHTRAFLKIQEGCNYSCSYCIIPTARGLSRSVPLARVLQEAQALANAGFKEIVLTGIHLGGYGHDLRPKVDLTLLLEMLTDSQLVPRIRLSSLDPREVPERLINLIAQSSVICPHLHICVQAGVDNILRRMRRNYDAAYYRDLVLKVREKIPQAALGSDIIVGFPGESEDDFERSVEFISSLPLTHFHVFPFSVRRGTVAAKMPDHVPDSVKKGRARRMRELGEKKKKEFCLRYRSLTMPVLIEAKIDRLSGAHKGFTRNYLPVTVFGAADVVNCEVEVQLDDFDGRGLTGRVVQQEAAPN